jgi:hypothetical protein
VILLELGTPTTSKLRRRVEKPAEDPKWAGVTRADKDSAPSGVHAGSSIDRRRVAFEAA